jgi:hypothetical protein
MNEPETKRKNKTTASTTSMTAVQPSELVAIEGGVAPQHLIGPLYPYEDGPWPVFPKPRYIA